MKIRSIIICFLFFLFFGVGQTFAIEADKVFLDIKKDYKYYNELQYLLDEGLIKPDESQLLNPKRNIKKGEFASEAYSLSCDECIQPETSPNLLLSYDGNKSFFDIGSENQYFYCSEASKDRGLFYALAPGHVCENGLSQSDAIPFCEQDTISLQEALKFGLQISGLFSNEQYLDELESMSLLNNSDLSLSKDVSFLNNDGTTNEYFLYLRKALGYILEERDLDGNTKMYDLLTIGVDDNIVPNTSLTREQYIYIMYIFAKSMDCGNDSADFATLIDIYPASCKEGVSCDKPELTKSVRSFDLQANYAGACTDEENETKDFIWSFIHIESGFRDVKFGNYIDDYDFSRTGVRSIILGIQDTCLDVSSASSVIVIGASELPHSLSIETSSNNITAGSSIDFKALTTDNETTDFSWDFGNDEEGTGREISQTFDDIGTYRIELISNGQSVFVHINVYDSNLDIAAFIDIYDKECEANNLGGAECGKADLKQPATIYDFYANYAGVCVDGIDETIGVVWKFVHAGSGTSIIQKGGYIEDFNFSKNGKRNITLTIIDNCGESGSAESTLFIGDGAGSEEGESSLGIEADAINVKPGEVVNFRGLSSDPLADDFSWDFGDGSKGSGKTISHSFGAVGSYVVELYSGGNKAFVTINVYEEAEKNDNDRDRDGVIDSRDRCVNVPGVAENAGCPVFPTVDDIDGDGTSNENDDCVTEPGPGSNRGCPDDDLGNGNGDNGGANDGNGGGNFSDGNGDADTACGGANGGCPSGYICSIPASGVGQGLCLLDDVCLLTLNGGSFGNVSCNSCPCRYSLDFDSELRICDIIFPAITSRDGSEIYSKGDVYQIIE